MKIYVAGKWEEREEVRKLQQQLRHLGHQITVDWTWHERDDPGFPTQYAVDDIKGVIACNAYVGIFKNGLSYKGALVEMGVALACGKMVFIIGHAIDSCLFVSHPSVQKFETELEFISFLRKC